MIETRESLEYQLQQHQNDIENHEFAIEKTRKLLERADLRRKEEGRENNRWNKTLDNLETTLDEIKHKLTISNNNSIIAERKLEHLSEDAAIVEIEENALPETMEEESQTKKQLIEAIFQRILASPVFLVNKLAESDINIAKVYVYSGAAHNVTANQVEEIKRRISIHERSKEKKLSAKSTKAKEDMSLHPGLHTALDKCIKQRYNHLTLEDLEAIRKYYEAITAKDTLTLEDQKRLELLIKSMEKINEYLTRFPKP